MSEPVDIADQCINDALNIKSGPLILRHFGFSLLLGVGITLVLLWTMQYLITGAEGVLDERKTLYFLDFVRVKPDELLQRKDNRPKKPPLPQVQPDEPPPPMLDDLKPAQQKLSIATIPVATDINLHGGFSLGMGEGDFLPIVKVAPLYPRRAAAKGIEGECVVQYTVTKLGTTRDIEVVDAECDSRLFRSPSISAARKFKYKPRVIDGQVIEVPMVRNRFMYTLERRK